MIHKKQPITEKFWAYSLPYPEKFADVLAYVSMISPGGDSSVTISFENKIWKESQVLSPVCIAW